MFSILAKIVPALLPILGKLGKGKATIVGDIGALVAGGAAFVAPHVLTDQNLVPVVHEVALVLIALFGMISSFGIGRKAADAA